MYDLKLDGLRAVFVGARVALGGAARELLDDVFVVKENFNLGQSQEAFFVTFNGSMIPRSNMFPNLSFLTSNP